MVGCTNLTHGMDIRIECNMYKYRFGTLPLLCTYSSVVFSVLAKQNSISKASNTLRHSFIIIQMCTSFMRNVLPNSNDQSNESS